MKSKGTILIIDGYNLLGKANQTEREALIQEIVGYKRQKKLDIIVFFDGTHGGTRYGDTLYVENVKVVYTPLHETADDHMIAFMDENTNKDIIAVSSDRKIQKAAQSFMFSFFDSEDFLRKMRQVAKQSLENCKEEPIVKPKKTTQKKGNPKRLSKKDRQKRQQLKKL